MDETSNSTITNSNSNEEPPFQDELEQFCSFAALGKTETFQAIFVCLTCQQEDLIHSWCVCTACMETCHASHEIEYMGMGLSYCDCVAMQCCRIAEASSTEAQRLGCAPPHNSANNDSAHKPTLESLTRVPNAAFGNRDTYTRDVWEMELLQDATVSDSLARQAQALVQHSRDTFWLDEATVKAATDVTNKSTTTLCDLEVLAWTILSRHVHHYGGDTSIRGAEWWVQVKPVTPAPTMGVVNDYHNGAEAVDLHYDKDEALAESFGVGLFPTLSTVTYLTDSWDAPPTLIFARRYDQGDNDREVVGNRIHDVMLCRPRLAKHVVFDGRLLHGAPSHFALRPPRTHETESHTIPDATVAPKLRITFLVNLWLHHKPANVDVLPVSIRESIQSVAPTPHAHWRSMTPTATQWTALPVANVDVTSETVLPWPHGPIELPFVGGKSTWAASVHADDDTDHDMQVAQDDENDVIVVVMYPPPQDESDTMLIHFGEDRQAYVQHLDSEIVDNEDQDEFDDTRDYSVVSNSS